MLLLVALAHPDLSNLKAKGAGLRLVIYPLGALAVPIWWWLRGRRRQRRTFPWAADLLVTLPWLSDLLGNRLDLFDSVTWWDDVSHFAHWLLLTAGVLLAWYPGRRTSGGVVVMVALGFGTSAALLWELGEYFAFLRFLPTYAYVYPDTLGDLTLGTSGSLLAGLLVALGRRVRPPHRE
ncbi:MAG: hypothetical protein ACRYG2_34625 [Janthinobacterium lividum]